MPEFPASTFVAGHRVDVTGKVLAETMPHIGPGRKITVPERCRGLTWQETRDVAAYLIEHCRKFEPTCVIVDPFAEDVDV